MMIFLMAQFLFISWPQLTKQVTTALELQQPEDAQEGEVADQKSNSNSEPEFNFEPSPVGFLTKFHAF